LPYDRPPLSKQVLALAAWPASAACLLTARAAADAGIERCALGVAARSLIRKARHVRLADGECCL